MFRLYEYEENKYNLLVFDKDGLKHEQVIMISNVELDSNIGEYYYVCNDGSSDLGTEVYLFKSQGEVVGKIWIDNGKFKDLEPHDLKNYDQFSQLLSVVLEVREKKKGR